MSRKNAPARNGQHAAVARRSNKAELQGLLESVDTRAALERVLPKYLTVERLIGLTMLATTSSPQLRQCTPGSVIQALMQAAQLGLEPNGPLGHAYLVPYGNVCTMIPGYRGLFFLAVDSGAIKKGVARLIYKGDEFQWIQGVEERIEHRPSLDADRSDENVVGAYAVVWHPDGSTQFEVMSRQEIDRVRASSKAAKAGPWVDWYGEMAKKTVVKRLLKQVAISTKAQRLADAIELDNRFESGEISGVMPEFDTEESLRAAVADRTQARAEELKERMRSVRGREVGRQDPPAPAEPEPDPEPEPTPAAEASDDEEAAAEIDYLQRKLFAAMKEHAPHLATDKEQRRQWQHRLTGHASIKRMDASALRTLIDAVERGDTDPAEPLEELEALAASSHGEPDPFGDDEVMP